MVISEIFYSIQGEGPHVGRPAVFIRLTGCNLSCNFCDETFSNGDEMSVERIVRAIDRAVPQFLFRKPLAVITGGEPFMQDFSPLLRELFSRNYPVSIETNGTVSPKFDICEFEKLDIVCSPKADHKIVPEIFKRVSAFKLLVSRLTTRDEVLDKADIFLHQAPCFIQPLRIGDMNKTHLNTDRAVELCKSLGLPLSVQMHKYIGVE